MPSFVPRLLSIGQPASDPSELGPQGYRRQRRNHVWQWLHGHDVDARVRKPLSRAELVSREADKLVTLDIPEYFGAVGNFYVEFRQVTDNEVIATLSARAGKAA